MALIEVADVDDKRLEEVAPSYLKGSTATTRRVKWAIEQTIKSHSNDPKAAEPGLKTEPITS